ncbi:hypothetical protein FACS1894159_06260 [Bacteroidia bacterium]|nr:hypothetical protein FACS1894159_06260 [Bacteroidia bacterium]
MKRIVFLSLLIPFATALHAQKVIFEANSPLVVGVGEPFRVEFSLNAAPVEFAAPDFAGFEVLAGPSQAQGQNISIVNGTMTKSVNYTITYVLQASSAGKFTIQPARVKVDGKSYATRQVTVEIVDPGSSGSQSGGGARSDQPQNGGGSGKISAEDLFATVTADRTTVYKGQPLKVVFKLYSRVNMSNVENVKFPAFNGFWTQELNSGGNWQKERHASREYDTKVIKEVLLYPQQSGTLSIEPFDMTAIVMLVTQRPQQSIMDAMMGAAQDVTEVRRKVTTQPVRITVKELPAGAPSSFNGAVGTFSMDVDAPKTPLTANSSGAITIKISGTGNLPLIQAPKLAMPPAFEQYNVKTTESLNPSPSGISGYRQFEYPFVARAEGEYDLGTIEFSYFSPEQMKYVTLRSGPVNLETIRDTNGKSSPAGGGAMVSALSKEDVKILGQDIRFIKLGSAGLRSKATALFGTIVYWLIVIVLMLLAAGAFLFLREHIEQRKDSAFVKGRKANKMALSRLASAAQSMKEGNKRNFYEEILKALWGYMGDRLNIPASMLTRESVREALTRKGVPSASAEKYIGVISECEYAQYSPDAQDHMGENYKAAVEVISKIESSIKR